MRKTKSYRLKERPEDRLEVTSLTVAMELFSEAGWLLSHYQHHLREAELDEALALSTLVKSFLLRLGNNETSRPTARGRKVLRRGK